MRKGTKFIAAILLLALVFSIPGLSVFASAEDETYTPVPYTLYPAPEGAYVGDTMPFVTEDGTLEIYYLYANLKKNSMVLKRGKSHRN